MAGSRGYEPALQDSKLVDLSDVEVFHSRAQPSPRWAGQLVRQKEAPSTAYAAVKDVLDRNGLKPAERTEHQVLDTTSTNQPRSGSRGSK